MCFELNSLGAQIWKAMRAGESVHSIVVDISREHNVDASIVSADVGRLVGEFLRHGLASGSQ